MDAAESDREITEEGRKSKNTSPDDLTPEPRRAPRLFSVFSPQRIWRIQIPFAAPFLALESAPNGIQHDFLQRHRLVVRALEDGLSEVSETADGHPIVKTTGRSATRY